MPLCLDFHEFALGNAAVKELSYRSSIKCRVSLLTLINFNQIIC